jgi:hypothetical protein
MKKKILDQINKIKSKFENNNEEGKKEIKNSHDYVINELNNINSFKLTQDEIKELNYYYKPNDSNDNPILLVAVVAFHHKKGSIIEYLHPNKEEIIKTHYEYLTSISDNQIDKTIDDILNQLTYFCLPDAVHNTNEDSQFFFIQNFKTILYGISCYKQIKTNSVEVDDENTRACVQKAICIVSKLPLFGQIYSKLNSTISAFFDQYTLKDKLILEQLWANYECLSFKNININEILMSFSLRKLIMFCKEKIFIILKCILMEKKIVVYSHVSNKICSFILSLISLIPGNFLFNLSIGNSVKNYMNSINKLGLPLKVFNSEVKVFPLFTLFDFNMLDGLKGFLIGTTNQMILNHTKIKFDIAINLDTQKIMISNEIPEKILKITKNEKNLYSVIYNKMKDNYSVEENWLINMNYYDTIFEGSDDFIRNEFKNYFNEFIINFDLLIYLIKNKDEGMNNIILDEVEDVEADESSDIDSETNDNEKKKSYIINFRKASKNKRKKK